MIRIYDSGHRGECRSEMAEQMDCISWLQYNHPDRWPLIFHVPGEIKASPQYMQRRQKEGVKAGIPDILDFGRIHGAFELKRCDKTKCSVSKEQRAFLESTDASGGFSALCYGFAEFVKAYEDYLIFVHENS